MAAKSLRDKVKKNMEEMFEKVRSETRYLYAGILHSVLGNVNLKFNFCNGAMVLLRNCIYIYNVKKTPLK